jgi:SAM-dependent methyltransferase
LSARVGIALTKIDRVLLHVDVATRPLADVKRALTVYWEDFNRFPDQWTSGFMPWEAALFDRWVRPDDRLLLIGCGSGRDLAAMIPRVAEIVAVEPASESLEIARRSIRSNGRPLTLLHGFVEDVELNGTFDVCWFSYFSYSYIPDCPRRVSILRRLAARLRPGGRIVLTCVCQPRPPRSRAFRIGQFASRLVRNDWQLAAGDELLRGQSAQTFHFQHVFSPEELESEVAGAGLRVIGSHFPEALVVAAPD